MNSTALPEVSEKDATGKIAETYEEIRRTVGLPLVNLVYRVLAAKGSLETAWESLGPNLRSPHINELSKTLINAAEITQPPIPTASLAAIGVEGPQLDKARSTIAAYVHANPRNMLAVTALLEEISGTSSTPPPPNNDLQSPPAWTILPMAQMHEIPPGTQNLLHEMSKPLASQGEKMIVPSLFRHFAHDPAVLALLWTSLAPAVNSGVLDKAAENVSDQACKLANLLPYSVEPFTDQSTREILSRFQFTLSRMIVTSRLLEHALGSPKPA